MDLQIPELAGVIATVIFAVGTLPMVVKAARTKDLRSYSRGNILLSNMGNVIQSIYVFSLPAGPIWVLHSFYLVTTALMLIWWVRYTEPPRRAGRALAGPSQHSAAGRNLDRGDASGIEHDEPITVSAPDHPRVIGKNGDHVFDKLGFIG